MRIAVITDEGLPSIRIERIIYLIKKYYPEKQVYLIGPFKGTSLITEKYLEKIYDLYFPPKAKLKIQPYHYWLKKKVKKILETIKADIVIGINYFSAILGHQLGYPVIFDDREFYPLKTAYYYFFRRHLGFKNKIIFQRTVDILLNDAYDVVAEHVTWTVSEYVKRIYAMLFDKKDIFVLRNRPSILELNAVQFKLLPKRPLHLCYISGAKIASLNIITRRLAEAIDTINKLDITGKELYVNLYGGKILESLKSKGFIYKGYIKNTYELLKDISNTHACLVAFTPVPLQIIYSPLKFYQCMAAGSVPIITDTMIELIKEFDRGIITVDSLQFEESLKEKILDLYNMNENEINRIRYESYEEIRKKPWDKYKGVIEESIRKAT